MPRPKPRLAPVTSAVAPASSLSDMTILPGSWLPAPFVTRSADIDQPDPEQSPPAGPRIRDAVSGMPYPGCLAQAAAYSRGRPNDLNRPGLKKVTIRAIPVAVTVGTVTA